MGQRRGRRYGLAASVGALAALALVILLPASQEPEEPAPREVAGNAGLGEPVEAAPPPATSGRVATNRAPRAHLQTPPPYPVSPDIVPRDATGAVIVPSPDCTAEDGGPGYRLGLLGCVSTQATRVHNPGSRFSNIHLAKLAGIPTLREVNLSNSRVTDLSPLAGLAALEDLTLSSTRVTDLSPLAGMSSLRNLTLALAPVSDLSPLASLTGLEELYLSRTNVRDLSPLAGLDGLRDLSLNRTPVTDLSPLMGLVGLRSLSINSTTVTDLTPLAGLASLRSLSLAGTPATDIYPLGGLHQLERLTLVGSQVEDLSPLGYMDSLAFVLLPDASTIGSLRASADDRDRVQYWIARTLP